MSHGCVESTRDTGKGEDEPCSSLGRPKADDFVRLVSKIVVAQICDSVGFRDLVGQNAMRLITRALEGFGDSHGFPGDSEIWNCLVGSGTVKEVVQASDPCADKIEQARQRRKAKRALLRLQQRLVCKALPETSASMVLDAKTENIQKLEGDHVSLLGAFVPVIEAMKNGLSERDGKGRGVHHSFCVTRGTIRRGELSLVRQTTEYPIELNQS
ncbi:hypothetical protein F3Y22_tig00111303pilonHSYRG00158 [Hibiscus syriacus]|uniref:Uncharacterized protein n=1 Tax=Hibiscus syriacus TaxID=106335 RepID=A0A6A2YR47_HIBSY|nr:hypothetical protein F3Y22_tig00111303pilonHSYRG00158 [Hibiscus syriacus]